MRVADSVRATSVVQRLKVGERFTDEDGDWEVARASDITEDEVTLYLLPYPNKKGQRVRSFTYPLSAQVNMLRS